jgi:hypothetical protein
VAAAEVGLAGAGLVATRLIGSSTGRVADTVADGCARSALGRCAAWLMPTATAVQPITADAARHAEKSRPTDMWSV